MYISNSVQSEFTARASDSPRRHPTPSPPPPRIPLGGWRGAGREAGPPRLWRSRVSSDNSSKTVSTMSKHFLTVQTYFKTVTPVIDEKARTRFCSEMTTAPAVPSSESFPRGMTERRREGSAANQTLAAACFFRHHF